MQPPTPFTYKRKQKIRGKVSDRLGNLSVSQKNQAISKIKERLSNTDNPNAAAQRARLGAYRAPLIQRRLENTGFKRPEVEGFKGAKNIGRLQDRITKAGSTDFSTEKLAALQAKLTEQKGFRKQIGTARREALGVDKAKLRYGGRKKKLPFSEDV